jgi:ankyrin repeat protein
MPLHSAALYGHKAVVELLLANGADISAKTPAGETSLQIATERGYKEIAELLRKHEAKKE